MTNREFAVNNLKFIEACRKANLPFPKYNQLGLTRQASKWRRGKGLAWKIANSLRHNAG